MMDDSGEERRVRQRKRSQTSQKQEKISPDRQTTEVFEEQNVGGEAEKLEAMKLTADDDVVLLPDTYWLTRIVYLRFLAFIYFVAFLVAFHQNKQLIGDRGLLPLKLHMEVLIKHIGSDWWKRIQAAPTLLWLAEPWNEVNPWLDGLAVVGMVVSSIVMVFGAANMFIMVLLWILYHSLVAVGQRWYGFGWESQLLETGMLGVWGVPLLSLAAIPEASPSSPVLIWGLRWLIFRIMLGAGMIKIRGDHCWLDLTCMNYHYQTQPVPNPMSYYLHQTPDWWHKTETFGNHIVELVLPFFTFLPRAFRITCGIGQILFQVILIISGNLSFLNWLTIVPSLAYFDDCSFSFLFSKSTKRKVFKLQQLQQEDSPMVDPGVARKTVNLLVTLLLGYLSMPVILNLISSRQIMNTSFDPFRIVNTYGAFGSITKERTEVVFEGTHSWNPDAADTVWHEYEFKCKPGRENRRPCLISPYHYRLDWLMWFAAFQSYEHNPWLVHLAGKFLVNDQEASSLIAHNPFLNQDPPKFVRALHYKYEYTILSSGDGKDWYKRKLKGIYLPPVDIRMLQPVFKRMQWKTLSKN
ncbi:lipase maturation factor 1-like isoform X3 [Panulirus ornatus]|uniref:lipase maturation factor 1-like isoform X3 n=1 Tax=Panulirus ornatus TaxID=150431 RepID=UPI003A863F8E